MEKTQLVLKIALTKLYITSGFECVEIQPFNAKKPLKSPLLINNKLFFTLEILAKHKRSYHISGKVLRPTDTKKLMPKKLRKTKTITQISIFAIN